MDASCFGAVAAFAAPGPDSEALARIRRVARWAPPGLPGSRAEPVAGAGRGQRPIGIGCVKSVLAGARRVSSWAEEPRVENKNHGCGVVLDSRALASIRPSPSPRLAKGTQVRLPTARGTLENAGYTNPSHQGCGTSGDLRVGSHVPVLVCRRNPTPPGNDEVASIFKTPMRFRAPVGIPDSRREHLRPPSEGGV